jgi:hypothetical protein
MSFCFFSSSGRLVAGELDLEQDHVLLGPVGELGLREDLELLLAAALLPLGVEVRDDDLLLLLRLGERRLVVGRPLACDDLLDVLFVRRLVVRFFGRLVLGGVLLGRVLAVSGDADRCRSPLQPRAEQANAAHHAPFTARFTSSRARRSRRRPASMARVRPAGNPSA